MFERRLYFHIDWALLAAILALCDHELGRLLDHFDAHDLWKDTALVVTTDHGFLLGEHDWWAKVMTPFFQEIAHIPFWAYDPREPGCVGLSRDALVQTTPSKGCSKVS